MDVMNKHTRTENLIHPCLQTLVPVDDANGDMVINHFSKTPCYCCGGRLAGERHSCTALIKVNGKVTALEDSQEVCIDCLVFFM